MDLDPYGLQQYGAKVWSQFNEDGILLRLIELLKTPHTFVEIGAGHNGENCTHVLHDLGWRGVWVEGNQRHFELLREAVPDIQIHPINVTVENVLPMLHDIPDAIGVLSIDIDGNDYWIWKQLCSERFIPSIVIIEFNAQKSLAAPFVMPYDPDYEWDHETYENGASLLSLIELGRAMGYNFVGTASPTPHLDSASAFFVRDDLTVALS